MVRSWVPHFSRIFGARSGDLTLSSAQDQCEEFILVQNTQVSLTKKFTTEHAVIAVASATR